MTKDNPHQNLLNDVRDALNELREAGEVGMKPDFNDWLTFHDKVAIKANHALTKLDAFLADVEKEYNSLPSNNKEMASVRFNMYALLKTATTKGE